MVTGLLGAGIVGGNAALGVGEPVPLAPGGAV
jgi:hypothetical protein